MMEEWVDGQGCDGFNIMPPVFPTSLREINALLIPELQRRGRFRTRYEGTTLRANLGITRPSLVAGRHRPPAGRARECAGAGGGGVGRTIAGTKAAVRLDRRFAFDRALSDQADRRRRKAASAISPKPNSAMVAGDGTGATRNAASLLASVTPLMPDAPSTDALNSVPLSEISVA